MTYLKDGEQQTVGALSETATSYELERFDKNAMFILNHFDANEGGVGSDIRRLKETFDNYGFHFFQKDNVGVQDVVPTMDNYFKTMDLKDYGCIMVVIFANFIEDNLIYFGSQTERQTTILDYFKGNDASPSLGTKPKILFVQTYEGKMEPTLKIPKKDNNTYFMPTDADILVIHGTFCKDITGTSGFVNILCDIITRDSDTRTLEAMLVEANAEMVPTLRNRQLPSGIENQLPIVSSTLTRHLFFKRKAYVKRDHLTEHESVAENYAEYVSKCLEVYLRDRPSDKIASSMALLKCHNKSQPELWSKLISKYLSGITDSSALKYFYPIPE